MYVCRKMRLCAFLMKKGFMYISEQPDKFNPERKVWLFENSPELRIAIEDYYSSDVFK